MNTKSSVLAMSSQLPPGDVFQSKNIFPLRGTQEVNQKIKYERT